MFPTKVVEKIETHISRPVGFSRKPCRLWDNVEKCGGAREAAHGNTTTLYMLGYQDYTRASTRQRPCSHTHTHIPPSHTHDRTSIHSHTTYCNIKCSNNTKFYNIKFPKILVAISYFFHVISRFRRGVNEIFALLCCYAEWTGSRLPTFQVNLSASSSRVKQFYLLRFIIFTWRSSDKD